MHAIWVMYIESLPEIHIVVGVNSNELFATMMVGELVNQVNSWSLQLQALYLPAGALFSPPKLYVFFCLFYVFI